MKKFNKILAINFGGIGDEIFFLPALISLKKEFPEAKITLALEPRSKSVKDLTDVIDDLFLIDVKGKNKYFELLKDRMPTGAILLADNVLSHKEKVKPFVDRISADSDFQSQVLDLPAGLLMALKIK